VVINNLGKLDDSQKKDLLEDAKTLLDGLNQKDWDATQINVLKSIIQKNESIIQETEAFSQNNTILPNNIEESQMPTEEKVILWDLIPWIIQEQMKIITDIQWCPTRL